MRHLPLWIALLTAPAFAEAVPYAINPHVSVSLPEGWTACDEATGKEVVNAASRAAGPACKPGHPGHLELTKLDLADPGILVVSFQENPLFTRKSIEIGAADGHEAALAAKTCETAARLLESTFAACHVAVSPISGEAALVGTAEGAKTDGPGGKTERVRVVTVPYAGGMMFLVGMERENSTVLEPILDSLAVQ